MSHEGDAPLICKRAFALGHPEKLIDFGHCSVHEMTVQGKSIIDAYYGGGPKLSFWNGCSEGGRQGIMEAMRYPNDYNAIIAGAASVGQSFLHGVRMSIHPDRAPRGGVALPVTQGVDSSKPAGSGVADQKSPWGADLIVMGSHWGTWLKRWFLRSVAECVVSHVRSSVEIVRHPRSKIATNPPVD